MGTIQFLLFFNLAICFAVLWWIRRRRNTRHYRVINTRNRRKSGR